MDKGVNCGSKKETNVETAAEKDEDTTSYFPDHFCDHHSFFCNIARAVLNIENASSRKRAGIFE